MLKGLIKAIEIINKEQEYVKKIDTNIYLGMEHIKALLTKEINSINNKR